MGDLGQVNQAVSDALANPAEYPELFPDYELTLAAEKAFQARHDQKPPPASGYAEEKEWLEMDVVEEIKKLSPDGFAKMLLRGPGAPPAETSAPPAAPPAAAPAAPPAAPPAEQAPVDSVVIPEVTPTLPPELPAEVPEVAPLQPSADDLPDLL